MSKKRLITLLTCFVIACTCVGVATACNSGADNPGTESSIVTEYKVKFDSRSGSEVPAQMVKSGEKVIKPEEPTREGYIFIEWQLDSNPYDFDAPVTKEITLDAKWELKKPEKFSVSFVVEGETELFHSTLVEDGKMAMKPAGVPEREDYLFDGWTLNGELYDFETPVTEPIILVAKWAKAWTVSFEVGEGTPIDPVVVKEGEGVTPPETTKAGYYVSGWLKDDLSYDLETPVSGDITLTAVWKASGLTSNQIGVHAYGWNQTHKPDYFNMETGENGEMVVTAKFSGSTTHYPALVLRELFEKTYYETLIENGETRLVFNLTIGGENAENVDDLYVFGKPLTEFAHKQGVYTISVDLQYIVDNYDKVAGIGTSVEAKNAEFSYMLLAWQSADWTTRNYVFTISNVAVKPTPALKVSFANGSSDVVKAGETTSITAETNVDEAIEWSSSNEAIATVENGVVTGVKSGEVTITASVEGLTESKTVYVFSNGLSSENIGMRVNGYNMTGNTSYMTVSTGTNGETVIGAKFIASWENYYAGLVWDNIQSAAYYQALVDNGYQYLTFDLKVDGNDKDKVEDLYVFCGQKLTTIEQVGGVYKVKILVSDIVRVYDRVKTFVPSKERIGQISSAAGMFLAWRDNRDSDRGVERNYIFTIANYEFIKTEV